jgi:hypothetical protein
MRDIAAALGANGNMLRALVREHTSKPRSP